MYHMNKNEQNRRVGRGLCISAGMGLTSRTFIAVFAIADLYVVQCHEHAERWNVPIGGVPFRTDDSPMGLFLWPPLFFRQRHADSFRF